MSQELLPPPSLHFVGGGDFQAVGEHFFKFFVDLCGLQPSHRVLDVGCGVGRMAIPLTKHLDARGAYEGFDIVEAGIRWCQENITERFPNFNFHWVDIHNKHYNPHAKVAPPKSGSRAWLARLLPRRQEEQTGRAAAYRFPYESASFDFVFLVSVFTHMLPRDMENYLNEVARVMRPGAKCLITYFLMNEQSTDLVDSGNSTITLPHRHGDYRVHDDNDPEHIIAYDEQVIRRMYAERRLTIDEPIRFGNWCRRPTFTSYQDIVIATKQ